MSDFDPEIDPEQTDDQRGIGIEPRRHRPGKSESVDETECEHDEQPPVGVVFEEYVFEGDDHDARGDDRLHDVQGELHVACGGEPQRERVGDGEGRDLEDERLPFPRHEEDAEDKEDVVQSLGDDVGEPAFDLGPEK